LETPDGGFASALDADTDGVEGKTYVWTPAELRDVLGADAPAAEAVFGVTQEGTFEHGASTLQLPVDPADPARWMEMRRRLLAARDRRAQPARDDKVVTAWNGLALAGLAEAGVLLDRPVYLTAAVRCADLLLARHLVDGRLHRVSRDGRVGEAQGIAEDYGDLAEGLLALHQATGSVNYLQAAGSLLDIAVARFGDGHGGFYDTADDAEALIQRPRDPTDNATPSGSSALAGALLTYAALTGSLPHRQAAETALRIVATVGVEQPRFLGWALAVAEGLIAGPVEVAIVGESAGLLSDIAWRLRPPGAVVVTGEPDAPGIPLLAGRPAVDGRPAAYVCRGMVCDAPVTDPEALRRQLAPAAPASR
jgi:uncharacterized protein YyaL (SSP411 family)